MDYYDGECVICYIQGCGSEDNDFGVCMFCEAPKKDVILGSCYDCCIRRDAAKKKVIVGDSSE